MIFLAKKIKKEHFLAGTPEGKTDYSGKSLKFFDYNARNEMF